MKIRRIICPVSSVLLQWLKITSSLPDVWTIHWSCLQFFSMSLLVLFLYTCIFFFLLDSRTHHPLHSCFIFLSRQTQKPHTTDLWLLFRFLFCFTFFLICLLCYCISCLACESLGMFIPSDGSGSSGPSSFNGSGGGRTKRMRTSFKHHQLRTMKQYFAINQNPDAKDLKALAQKTNLSKRVLQVWFQNARAKWRRNNLRMQGGCSQDVNTSASSLGLHVHGGPSSTDCGGNFSSSSLLSDPLSLKAIHGIETPTSSASCPVLTGHEMSCSPGGSSTRPYSSPSESPGLLMTGQQQTSGLMNREDFRASPPSSSPHHPHLLHIHPHGFHHLSHLHSFQHQHPIDFSESLWFSLCHLYNFS